jgi:hypothetical protein
MVVYFAEKISGDYKFSPTGETNHHAESCLLVSLGEKRIQIDCYVPLTEY